MATVEFTRAADRDLIEIYLYGIEYFGASRAERYLEALNTKIEIVAEYPDFGSDYSYVASDLRRYEAMSHAI